MDPDNKQTDGKKPIQCHFISNTHWDREWRFSMQRTRHMLVHMMDMLLDILEKYPEYRSFHLDSQTIPIQDYLDIRPEKEQAVKNLVKEKRLFIGPWFCLPDEFCVSGESLIRNLLLGHKIGRQFGHVSKTGYSPFSWGQVSQMPQIYKGFGIEFAAFYRGINTLVAPRSEIVWEGADGSRVIASRLGLRPRYNVWYVLQRPAFWNEEDVGNRLVSWSNGHGGFKMIGPKHHLLDAQYAHPGFDYHKETIPERAAQAIEEQDNDWTTPHRFWSCGHDSSCPDIREIEMIKDANAALDGTAEVFHSNFQDFQDAVCSSVSDDLPVAKGEMRNLYTEGSTSALFGWIISARMDVKQDNFRTERDLTGYAEPLAVFSSLLGTEYPQGFIDNAYNWLLQNHGHDSIGGCSREIISDDMLFRSRQSREISGCVTEKALKEIAGSIKIDTDKHGDGPIIVYNPAPFKRSETMQVYLQIPKSWDCETIAIVDGKGNNVEFSIIEREDPFYQIVQSPNDCANIFPMVRYLIDVHFEDVPAMGYKTFFAKPVEEARQSKKTSLVTAPGEMANEHLSVKVNSNGTLDICEKLSGRVFDDLGYFKDSSEIGNPWEHTTVANKAVFTTTTANADVVLVKDTAIEASYRVTIAWKLPEGRTKDDKSRSPHLVDYRIVNTVTLRKGQQWVEITTDIDNNAQDHYLQVCFPSAIDTNKISVQGQFDVIERSLEQIDPAVFDEIVQTEHPMNSFVDLSDNEIGLGLLNEGLKAYEVLDSEDNTLCLTLLRSFPLRICVTQEMTDYSNVDKSSQCLGKHSFRYGIMPHGGDWVMADMWQQAERFNLAMLVGQISPTKHGTEPIEKSFLELKEEGLDVSAVKRSENGGGWVVRLFNPFDRTITNKIRLNGGLAGPADTASPVEAIRNEYSLPASTRKFSQARKLTLEEMAAGDMQLDADGWLDFEIKPKQILTLEFLP